MFIVVNVDAKTWKDIETRAVCNSKPVTEYIAGKLPFPCISVKVKAGMPGRKAK